MTAAASRRQLHTELHRLRVAAGVTQTAVARAHEWSPSKVHRIEKGLVSVSRTDLLALLTYYAVTDEETVANLLELARLSRNQAMPFADFRTVFPPEIIRFFGYEASASSISELELLVIPGLLQIPEYTRVLIADAHGVEGEDRIEKFVESRRTRQQILDQPVPPTLSFILDEAVLSRRIGGVATMERQLAHLLDVASRPAVSVQILPLSAGAHPGLRGPFTYLRFAAENDPDVVYTEYRRGDSIFDNEEEITGVYRRLFHDLEKQASPPDELSRYVDRALQKLHSA
jgi:transcriptional regulator with XRE-family HTH domain